MNPSWQGYSSLSFVPFHIKVPLFNSVLRLFFWGAGVGEGNESHRTTSPMPENCKGKARASVYEIHSQSWECMRMYIIRRCVYLNESKLLLCICVF